MCQELDKEILTKYAKGLICTSACLRGEVAQNILNDKYEEAKKTINEYKEIFGDDYYLEIMDHGMPEQKKVNEGIIKLSKEMDVPVIATNDVHYLNKSDSVAHDALLCIQTRTKLSDPKRMKLPANEFLF